jgi:lipoate-protein ligase A
MAIDEAIFRVSQRSNTLPTLRLYGWTCPSVSLGYFQEVHREIDVIACRRHDIPVVRRPTGGKAVLHDTEVTYAVVAKEKNPLFSADLMETYRVIARCIADGLARLGMEAHMADDGRSPHADSLSSSCFATPARHELLVNNRKICGSAQVRSRGAFLQHGTILMAFDPLKTCDVMLSHSGDYVKQVERLKRSVTSVIEHAGPSAAVGAVCGSLRKGFEKTLDIELIPGILSPEEETLAAHLMTHKYMNERWNMKGGCRSWM